MLHKMFGIEMNIPTGKLPGFYAQVIHKIGDHVHVYDRDKQLFIVENEQERALLVHILAKYNMCGEEFTLWLLPSDVKMRLLTDYGFTSISDRSYLYDYLISRFRINESIGSANERFSCLAQMKQHILASVTENEKTTYIVDTNHKPLLDKMAQVFHSSLIWLDK